MVKGIFCCPIGAIACMSSSHTFNLLASLIQFDKYESGTSILEKLIRDVLQSSSTRSTPFKRPFVSWSNTKGAWLTERHEGKVKGSVLELDGSWRVAGREGRMESGEGREEGKGGKGWEGERGVERGNRRGGEGLAMKDPGRRTRHVGVPSGRGDKVESGGCVFFTIEDGCIYSALVTVADVIIGDKIP
ncbi:hypothetical protein Tco_0190263 [Tanacetum coccineum]